MSFNSSTIASEAAGPRFGFASFFPRRWSSRERKSEASVDGAALDEESSGAEGIGAEDAVGGHDAGIKFSMVHQTIGSTPASSGGYIAAAGGGAIKEAAETPIHGVGGAALDACGTPDHEKVDNDAPLGPGCCANHNADAANGDQLDACPLTPNVAGENTTPVACGAAGHEGTGTAKGSKDCVVETAGRVIAGTAKGGTKEAVEDGTGIPNATPIAGYMASICGLTAAVFSVDGGGTLGALGRKIAGTPVASIARWSASIPE